MLRHMSDKVMAAGALGIHRALIPARSIRHGSAAPSKPSIPHRNALTVKFRNIALAMGPGVSSARLFIKKQLMRGGHEPKAGPCHASPGGASGGIGAQ